MSANFVINSNKIIENNIVENYHLWYQVSIYLLVKKLLSWLSGFEELFTVKHSMLIVKMTTKIPVECIHVCIENMCNLGEPSHWIVVPKECTQNLNMLTISSSAILWMSWLRLCCHARLCARCSLMSLQLARWHCSK